MKIFTNIYNQLNKNAYILLTVLVGLLGILLMVDNITNYKLYLTVFVLAGVLLSILIASKKRKLPKTFISKETNRVILQVLTRETESENAKKRQYFYEMSQKTFSNDELIKMSKSDNKLTQVFVGLNLSTPNIILEEYSMSEDTTLQYAAASNKNTPQRMKDKVVWEQLTDVKDEDNQIKALNNPNTPTDVLTKIYETPYNADEVIAPLLQHPNVSDDLVKTLLEQGIGSSVEQFLMLIGVFLSNPNLSNKPKSIAAVKSYNYDDITAAAISETVFNNKGITYKALDLWGSDIGRNGIEKAVKDTTQKLALNPNETEVMNDQALVWVYKNIPTLKRLSIDSIKAKEPSWNEYPDEYIVSSLTPSK